MSLQSVTSWLKRLKSVFIGPHTTCPLCQGDTGLLCQTKPNYRLLILQIDENHESNIPTIKKRDGVCESGDLEACFIFALNLIRL